jgi:hypothetical protein
MHDPGFNYVFRETSSRGFSIFNVPRVFMTKEVADQKVSGARLRIAQVALIGAMDVNRALLTDPGWQQALVEVNRMIADATPDEDASQMVLFPSQAMPRSRSANVH